jgi:ribonuclease D
MNFYSSYDLFDHDLPESFPIPESIAIDTEAMGLNTKRDRLCLIQLSLGDGKCIFIKPSHPISPAPRLCRLLENPGVQKIFHYARFDVALLQHTYGVQIQNIYCTKIASKLVRTYTERHGLKDLCRDLLAVEISKEQQSSDWGAECLSPEQLKYAAHDVLHLHALKEKLDLLLKREDRHLLAAQCFQVLSALGTLDALGFEDLNVFKH